MDRRAENPQNQMEKVETLASRAGMLIEMTEDGSDRFRWNSIFWKLGLVPYQ